MFKRFLLGLLIIAIPFTVSASTTRRHFSAARLMLELHSHEDDTAFPYVEPTTGEKHLEDFKKLVAFAHTLGIRVGVAADMDDYGLYGLYAIEQHIIILNPSLSTDGATEVLCHELAHVLADPTLPKPDDDVVAQGVAYVVGSEIGLDDQDETLYYFFWLTKSFEKSQMLVLRHGKEIDSISQILLTVLGK